MGLDHVDVYYSHRPDPTTPFEETMAALDTAVRSGKARYAGISSYSPEQTRQAAALLRELGTPLLLHQPSYSLFDRWVEDGLLDTVEEVGAGTIVFSPLAQGLLTDRYLQGVPAGSRATHSRFLSADEITDDVLERVRALGELAAARGQTLAQLALAWVLRDPRVTAALIGASSVRQLEDNVAALANTTFSDEELAAIDQIVPRGD
jgi:L-glyceraldehyde 3-phosphate reductase